MNIRSRKQLQLIHTPKVKYGSNVRQNIMNQNPKRFAPTKLKIYFLECCSSLYIFLTLYIDIQVIVLRFQWRVLHEIKGFYRREKFIFDIFLDELLIFTSSGVSLYL
jgi:hypothetical protein